MAPRSSAPATKPIISPASTLDLSLTRWTRILDLAIILILVLYVIFVVVHWYREPYISALLLLPPPAILAYRLGLDGQALTMAASGAIIGPLVEIICVAGGLWTYAETGGLPFVPPLLIPVWACFPLALWLTVRSVLAEAPSTGTNPRTLHLALMGIGIEIVIFVTLGHNTPLAIAAVLFLSGAVLITARKSAAFIIMVAGAFLGPVCEVLPVAAGAWTYANPEVLGMPAWLPFGYAVFAVLVAYAALAASVYPNCASFSSTFNKRS